MHHSAYVNCEKFVNKYCHCLVGKKVLDVGSYNVNGTLKPLFETSEYIGLDIAPGPNVDILLRAHKIPFTDNYFDIVISSSCFEHDDMFWETFLEMCRVTKPDGLIYIQVPSNGPYHGYPVDNWRFYLDSWKALEKWGRHKTYDITLIEHYIDATTCEFWNDSIGIYRKNSAPFI